MAQHFKPVKPAQVPEAKKFQITVAKALGVEEIEAKKLPKTIDYEEEFSNNQMAVLCAKDPTKLYVCGQGKVLVAKLPIACSQIFVLPDGRGILCGNAKKTILVHPKQGKETLLLEQDKKAEFPAFIKAGILKKKEKVELLLLTVDKTLFRFDLNEFIRIKSLSPPADDLAVAQDGLSYCCIRNGMLNFVVVADTNPEPNQFELNGQTIIVARPKGGYLCVDNIDQPNAEQVMSAWELKSAGSHIIADNIANNRFEIGIKQVVFIPNSDIFFCIASQAPQQLFIGMVDTSSEQGQLIIAPFDNPLGSNIKSIHVNANGTLTVTTDNKENSVLAYEIPTVEKIEKLLLGQGLLSKPLVRMITDYLGGDPSDLIKKGPAA